MSTPTTASLTSPLTSTIKLNNGISMPRVHLGVYMTSGRETTNAVTYALEAGYRAIDSAEWYGNEKAVGDAITSFLTSSSSSSSSQTQNAIKDNSGDDGKGLKREDIWFTTKLQSNVSYDETRREIKKSVKECGLGYVDLYLLHSPYGGKKKRLECWRAVEDAIGEGEVRVGGVSNFGVKHLRELLDSKPRITPAINQIEVHPFNTRNDIVSFCAQHDIIVQAYAPLARAMRFKHPVVTTLAKKYGVSPAQVMVRWSLQKGYVPLPKSTKRERIVSNADVGGFVLEEDEVRRLDGCDEYLVTDWDPTDAA